MKFINWVRNGGMATALLSAPAIALAQFSAVNPFSGTSQRPLIDAITAIVNIFLILAALTAAVFLVIGGIKYITSQGDEDAAEEAKRTILFAVIGLIVIGISAAVVNFTIGAVQS